VLSQRFCRRGNRIRGLVRLHGRSIVWLSTGVNS
ncbi:regulatory protein uhpC, partial [Vibrio parahaemolyticus VPTS-2010_2]